MHYSLCLLFFLTLGHLHGQQTSPMEILFQEQPSLRIRVCEVPQAKKAFNHYRLKIISGTVVGSSGVILLNHSLGRISPQVPHEWAITGIGAGLVTSGLFITRGAKKKRQEAIDILDREKKVAFEWRPGGFAISF